MLWGTGDLWWGSWLGGGDVWWGESWLSHFGEEEMYCAEEKNTCKGVDGVEARPPTGSTWLLDWNTCSIYLYVTT